MRKRIPILIVLSILVFSLGLTAVVIDVPPSSTAEWSYNVGDTLEFNLTITGSEAPYTYLNNQILTTNITGLQDVDWFLSKIRFLTMPNTNQTMTYMENGTLVPIGLNQLISRSIIPVGAYGLIDDWFVDEPANPYGCNTYISSLSGNLLSYGYRQYNVDAGSGWNCVVNVTSGLPVYVEIWREDAMFQNRAYNVVLTFVNYE